MFVPCCDNCKSVYVVKLKERYQCKNCNKLISFNKIEGRFLENNDISIIDEYCDKDYFYELIFKKNKNKILNRKDVDSSLKRWLNVFYIRIKLDFEITVQNLHDFLCESTYEDKHCVVCGKELPFIGIRNSRYDKGYHKTCESDVCFNKLRSINQTGENNTRHRMTEETKINARKKQSATMKEKIKNGEFIPNVLNSWNNDCYICNINGKIVKYRSSWESFFNIVNKDFKYEKLVIPYKFNGEDYNYIVDFIDEKNKIIYEIKPLSETSKLKNIIKEKYAMDWCLNNNYLYKQINDDWFNKNYKKYKHLLKNQSERERLEKNLRQFE